MTITQSTTTEADATNGVAIRGTHGGGHDSLPATRHLLADASTAIAREPNRMGAWRMLGAALEARKAFQTHMGLCRSRYGPLLHVAEERPWLRPTVDRILAEQDRILARLDDLIARAARNKGSSDDSTHDLRASAVHCDAAVAAYERRYHGLAFEWVNREIGGPGA
ncbi:MAG: hypothetical protein U5Q44_13615 [Dehalococcoidia bacterium]|nr:hypothetical protein [Dehalococcoidia bacterium]